MRSGEPNATMLRVTAIASSPALPLLRRRPVRTRPAPAKVGLDSATVVEHLDAMYRFALALSGSPHDAQDVVQDACLRVLARPRKLDRGRERGYLLVAVRHAWFDRLRVRSARPQSVAIDELTRVLAGRQPGLDEIVDSHRVYGAIAQLAEPHRLVVAAVDVAGLSYADAADLLEVPVGTVMSRLHRGRAKVAAALAS